MSTRLSFGLRESSQLLYSVLRNPVQVQTYRNLLYLLLTLPLGTLYFVILTTGFLTGIPLIITIVGIPIIILLLALVVELARIERVLVRVLLGIDIRASPIETRHGYWVHIKRLVTDLRTWKATAYLLSEFLFGTVTFALVSSLLATSGSFLLAPLYYSQAPVVAYSPIPSSGFTLDVLFGWDSLLVGLTTTFRLGSWQIETLPSALLIAILGVVLLVAALQLVNTLAVMWGRYARIMLTVPRRDPTKFTFSKPW